MATNGHSHWPHDAHPTIPMLHFDSNYSISKLISKALETTTNIYNKIKKGQPEVIYFSKVLHDFIYRPGAPFTNMI